MPIDINTEMTSPSAERPHPAHIPTHPDPSHALPAPPRRSGLLIVVVVLAILVIAGVIFRLLERSAHEKNLSDESHSDLAVAVNVVHPTVNGGSPEIALPGNTMAFDDTPIYARTSGYLKKWYVDLGAHVTQGQLMATIETPELDEQLAVAKANLLSAQADLKLADTTSERYQNLLKSDSVSKQETDVAVSGAAAKKAAVEAAEANVRRLQQLQSFEQVYAPYSGVVTERNTDIGDLIDAGSPTASNTAKELYRIASVNTLRVFVPVPEIYAGNIHNGDKATLTLDEYPGQQFTGIIARNSNAIDQASRTLNVEVDVPNADGKLLPGAYVFVHFKVPQGERQLSVPSNTLLFRAQGLQVALVRDGKVHLQNVTIAHDGGKTVEIGTGLEPNDQIIVDPPDSISEGEPVSVANHGQVNQ